MKKPSNSKMKSQELRSLVKKLLVEADEHEKRIADLEGYEKLFKEGKINHHRNPHEKVVKIKGEILGAQSAYDYALMEGLGNMSVSTGLIIDLVDYAQQSDKRMGELEMVIREMINCDYLPKCLQERCVVALADRGGYT